MLKKLEDWVTMTPKNTALLVIDMQVDFCSPKGKAAKRGKSVLKMQNMAGKLEKFAQHLAKKGVLVIFTRFVSGAGITPENLRIAVEKEEHKIPCVKGSGGEELYNIKVSNNALVIDKPHYDAFAHTKINNLLKQKNIKNILITGVRTEVCIDVTAKRAASEGYNTYIISDLVATYDDKYNIHNYLLNFFKDYYGFVVNSDEILKLLK